jgi:hypothetical protein
MSNGSSLTAVGSEHRSEIGIEDVSVAVGVPDSPFFRYNYYLRVVSDMVTTSGLHGTKEWHAPTPLFCGGYDRHREMSAVDRCLDRLFSGVFLFLSRVTTLVVLVMAAVARDPARTYRNGVVIVATGYTVALAVLWAYALVVCLVNDHRLQKGIGYGLQIPVLERDNIGPWRNVVLKVWAALSVVAESTVRVVAVLRLTDKGRRVRLPNRSR